MNNDEPAVPETPVPVGIVETLLRRHLKVADLNVADAQVTLQERRQAAHQAAQDLDDRIKHRRVIANYVNDHFL